MITTTFSIKPYLAQYMYVRYAQSVKNNVIHLPHDSSLYHNLHNLSKSREKGVSWKETGNITFALPCPQHGKNPEKYNYFSKESILFMEQTMDVDMRMELYTLMKKNKFKNGIKYKTTLISFIKKYGLEELIEEETLMKAFQRWREKCLAG